MRRIDAIREVLNTCDLADERNHGSISSNWLRTTLAPTERLLATRTLDLGDYADDDITAIAELLRESAAFGTEFDGILHRLAEDLESLTEARIRYAGAPQDLTPELYEIGATDRELLGRAAFSLAEHLESWHGGPDAMYVEAARLRELGEGFQGTPTLF